MTRTTLLGSVIALAACTGTRTGNPGDEPPSYESGSRFAEEPTGAPDQGLGRGDPCSAGGSPGGGPRGSDFVRLRGDRLVVAARERGLVVIDVRDPSAPRLEGELALDGAPIQLEVDPDGTGATLAWAERTPIDATGVPDGPVSQGSTRLVRVDLADSTRPRQAFDMELATGFWQFEARGDRIFVLEQLTAPVAPMPICGSVERPCYESVGMRVTSYDVTGSGFAPRDSAEVSAGRTHAFVAEDTFFVVSDDVDDAIAGPDLHWVDFGSGALTQGGPVVLPGRPVEVSRQGDTAALLLEKPVDEGLSLQVMTFDAAGRGMLRGATAVSRNLANLRLDPRRFAVLRGSTAGSAAVLVDVRDPDAPRVASTFPADVSLLLPAGTAFLGIGRTRTLDDLVISLWDVADPSAPVRRASVTTGWHGETGDETWTVDVEHGLLLIPFTAPPDSADGAFRLGVFRFDDTSLSLHSEQPSRVGAWNNIFHPITDGTHVFSKSDEGLEVFPLQEGARESEPVSAFLPFHPPETIDAVEAMGYAVALRERKEEGVFYVEATPLDGGDPVVLDLDHRGDALVVVGGSVVALGVHGEAGECEYLESLGIDPSEVPDLAPFAPPGVDPCAAHRRRGVSVLSLARAPRVTMSTRIHGEMDVDRIEGIGVRALWPGYLHLPDGRLALFAERTQECDSHAECNALGVPAHERLATPGGCISDTQDCPKLPPIEASVSYKQTLAVYVLEGAGGATPELVLGTVLDRRFEFSGDGDWSLDLSWETLATDDGLALVREDPIYDATGNSVTNKYDDAIVRFFLDRMVVRKNGTLDALAPVNTPGRPVALDGDVVYTVEPAYERDGTVIVKLHRAALRDGGAFIERSVDLGSGFSDARAVGDHLFVLRGPPDWCAEEVHTDLFAVSLAREDLDFGEVLELPGPRWSFSHGPTVDNDGALVIEGGPLSPPGRLFIDISDPMHPRVERYTSAPID